MIVVTGATGTVGSEAVRLLAQQGIPVRAFVRDAGKAAALAAAGAQIAVGDLGDPDTLDVGLDGADAVILVSPAVPEQELNVVAAAARAGVAHVTKVSSKASPDSPIARRRGQSEIEAGLGASGVPHTILRPNAYMQNFLALAPVIRATGGFASSAAGGQVGLTDARDVAAVAAHIAAAPTEHAGADYLVTGPQLMTYTDVAEVLSCVLGTPVRFTARSHEEDRAAMLSAGVPAPVAQMNAQAFSLIAHGDAQWLSETVPTLLHRPARSFEHFAQDHRAAFA